mmetsp:Transcript_3145/g.7377  ORF Transcript_3145/g.7377 Transcript_3145/m.7377 type:complete len:342 (+) Transcript_3145:275-1300(+)
MLMQGIQGRRIKRIAGHNNKTSSRIRSPIPIQYVIISLAFFIALFVNAIEEQQSTLEHAAVIWNHDSSSKRSKEHSNDDAATDAAATRTTERRTSEDDDDSSMNMPTNMNISANNNNNDDDDDDKNNPTPSSSSSAETPIMIGWVVTITGCGGPSDTIITDGAAVLKHSIHLTSIHGSSGNNNGKYDYQMYAIYHPEGEACALPLKDLGYELIRRETPVAVQDIKGKFLRKKIESNGCCGEKELIKLEAYTLTDHPIVVQLDLDVIVLKPMDPLFDLMLLAESPSSSNLSNVVPIMWPDQAIPKRVNAFFTRDFRSLDCSRATLQSRSRRISRAASRHGCL